jgi:DNA topoisomerase-1
LKNLIIVESPTKAKTIKNFLGKEYDVIASKGHIRDLPQKSFGIKIEDNKFTPQYRVARENSAIVKEIKTLAKNSEKVYIATDEDREGEAIGYHIAYAIGKDPLTLPRIVFHEITKKAILHSLENPRTINMNEVNAQQTRRLLDRIVGYKLSPLLASKIQKGLSAGRVQSSALKIIVDREREIQNFKPVEYHTITADFNDFVASLVEFESNKISKLSIGSTTEANRVLDTIDRNFAIESIDKKLKTAQSIAPFMTSTLQQNASNILGYSPRKTMQIAQKLYEGVKTNGDTAGVITYMRTDSLNISKEFQESTLEVIKSRFGEEYLPKSPKIYKSKSKNAQEAHEAIRPTILEFTPQIAKEYLSNEEYRVYSLIYNRYMASQMRNPEFDSQTVTISSSNSKFRVSGKKIVFDGFYRAWSRGDKDIILPQLIEGQSLEAKSIDSKQNFTEPPSRYSEASLIKNLESLGIGRPSTYAPTISLLKSREYISVDKKQLVPQEIAFKVIKLLEEYFSDIVNAEFTANMEDNLDRIAYENEDWEKILSDFYSPFIQKVEDGKKSIPSQKVLIPIGEACPECGEELVKRKGRYGEFISCISFPKCKYTRNIDDDNKEETQTVDEVCDKCGKPMVKKRGRRGEFLACSGYPECKNIKSLQPVEKIETKCPECGGELLKRNSRRGSFFGCSNYPKCKFISKFEPTDKKCSKCGYNMAKRDYRGKEIYECIKCKEREDI